MAYIESKDRNQISFIPDSIDLYVDGDNFVRVLDAFVEELDFEKLNFKFAEANRVGAPSYNPKTMLKLYLYSYHEGIRSSRKIERLTYVNLEAMWLTSKLQPDHKTIANFRKNNHDALLHTFEAFNYVFSDLEMFGKDLVVLDGTKIRGNNSKNKNYTLRKIQDLEKNSEEQMANFLHELDENDKLDDSNEKDLKQKAIKEKLANAKKKLDSYSDMKKQMKNSQTSQVSIVDPDARRMRSSTGVTVVGYNIQVCVDAKNKLPVAFEVTNNGNDFGQLAKLSIKAKQFFESTKKENETINLKVIADTGYYEAEEFIQCKKNNIETYVSKRKAPSKKEEGYKKSDFIYILEEDIYLCPQGFKLSNHSKKESQRHFYYNPMACKVCNMKDICSSNQHDKYRIIETYPNYEEIYREVDLRVESNKPLMKKRKAIVEHPFGTMKVTMHGDYFLTRRKKNIGSEMALMLCAYNFKRVFNELKKENRTWDMVKK